VSEGNRAVTPENARHGNPGAPNPVSLALSDRKTGILPVREDSASGLFAHETTGWKPVVHVRQDAYLPAEKSLPPAMATGMR